MNKIAGEVGHLAGNIAVEKDNLVEMAGKVIDSVKEKIHEITTKKKAAPKKALSKRVKPVAKKTAKAASKKKASVKKVSKKK